MTKKAAGINPEKMARLARHLWEVGEVAMLTKRELAAYVGVPVSSIYYWFAGKKPRKGHERLILEAIQKIRSEHPDPVMETLPSGAQVSAASWGNPELDEEDPAIVADRAFGERLRVMFNMLQDKLTDPEKRILAVSWVGFSEVVNLAEKHGISIPKK